MRPTRRSPNLPIAAAFAASLLIAVPAVVRAQAADPGVTQVSAFDDTLLSTMKQGDSLGVNGRYKRLEPAVEKAFDMPTMTRFAVGPTWGQFSPADQHLLIEAFTRLSTASFAKNFASYSGEKFVVDPTPDNRGVDKIVKTQLVQRQGAPVVLDYRMRQSGGTWKVIDVLFNGTISQLTTRRSDLAAVAAGGDAKAIAQHLNAQADKLLK